MRSYCVLIAEPNLLVREKIASLAARHARVWCVVEVGAHRQALVEASQRLRPDLILADLGLLREPGLVDSLRQVVPECLLHALIDQAVAPYLELARWLGLDGAIEKGGAGDVIQQLLEQDDKPASESHETQN